MIIEPSTTDLSPTAGPTRPGRLLRLPATVIVALVLGIVSVTGCAGGNGEPTSAGPRVVNEQVGDTQWVYFRRPGGPETDKHVGYVRRRVLTFDDGTEVVHRVVLDNGDRSLGYYIEADGRTYRQTASNPAPEELGTFDAQGAMIQLFGKAGVYNLVRK